ncbi:MULTISPECIES: hypothetical protein [Haloarcula]|uniref:hypothetical protein n=1 Tax=Haloarcula TaxID=2237 RepID=UPI0023EB3062|nr:hypothetical protein [Halomicroarcula sp. XH51]
MTDLDALRDESYTGANRCWPCTVVNLVVLSVFVLLLRVRERTVASLVVGTLGLVVVYLRGYLVPYTPRFAPPLVAASPLPDDLFHGDLDADDGGSFADDVTLDGERVLGDLLEAGVVVADDEMLFLSDDVDADWHERMDQLADRSLDDLAVEVRRTLAHVEDADSLVADDREWVVVGAADDLVARPLAIAELAAYEVLDGRLDDQRLRLAAAESFRMFLEDCPACGTELRESSGVSCCGGYTAPRESPRETLVCPSCKQRLYTFPAE